MRTTWTINQKDGAWVALCEDPVCWLEANTLEDLTCRIAEEMLRQYNYKEIANAYRLAEEDDPQG